MSASNRTVVYTCSFSKAGLFMTFGISAVKTLLLLPLSIFILFLGYQQWKQQRSFRTAGHSDLFAYHLAAMETLFVPGFVCFLCGTYKGSVAAVTAGVAGYSLTVYGEILFQTLTCVEWYLAVARPVFYRGLRGVRGAGVRNVVISCVWLLCFGLVGLQADLTADYVYASVTLFLGFSITVVSFCSVSVLRVLNRAGPGDGGEEKKRADSLKRRGFVAITAIASVLWLWLAGLLVAIALSASPVLSLSVKCAVMPIIGWFNIPLSLVLPLLFLHRAGKLSCCANKPE